MTTNTDLATRSARYRKSFLFAGILGITTLLAACGGGGGGAPAADSGTPTTETTSSGSVSGFGSVIVNGVRYDDSNVAVTIDNNANATAEDLRLGMVVDVQGPVDAAGLTGTAERITARSFVQGPITAVDLSANQFTVLGVTVNVNAGTIFDGAAGIADLAAGERVEIYGYGDNAGNLAATRIEREAGDAASGEIRLTGAVTAASPTSFTINGVTVQYNAAAAITIDEGVVTDGMVVRVSGTLADPAAIPLTINATDIRELETAATAQEGQRVELEGVVTAFRSATDFDVNGRPVTVDADAEVEGTPAQGAIIEVEGTITNGILVANEVDVKDPEELADADVTGPANNIDTTAQTFTMRGGRLTIRWDANTEFDSETLPNGAASLTNNQVLEVDGRIEGNVIVAESIEGVAASGNGGGGRLEVEGLISNLDISGQTFTLRNGRLTVRWDASTEFDSQSLPNGAASLTNRMEIEADGRLEGNVFMATRIEAKGNAGGASESPAQQPAEPPTEPTPTT